MRPALNSLGFWHAAILAVVGLSGAEAWAREPLPDCAPLGETTLRGLVSDGIAFVDRGDAEGQRDFAAAMVDRLPCLTFAPSPRLLAQVFVLLAIERYEPNGDRAAWTAPLTAAVCLYPRVDRLVGDQHDISVYEVPECPAAAGAAVPDGVVAYVDGARTSVLPTPGELHLVQVRQGDRWRSGLFTDAVPERWLTDRIRPPTQWSWWANAGLAIGPGGVRQWSTAPVLADQPSALPHRSQVGAWPTLVGRTSLRYGALGVWGEVDGGMLDFTLPVGSHAQGAVVVGRGSLQAGVGGGVGGSLTLEAAGPTGRSGEPDYVLRGTVQPYGLGTVLHTGPTWDGGVAVGVGPAVGRVSGAFGWAPSVYVDELPLRIGVSAVAQQGRFEPRADDGTFEVTAVTWRAGLEIGVRTFGAP